jgi:hypothetical protein
MARDLKEKVERFARQLEEALGDNLVSLLLYGPAVRQRDTGPATLLLLLHDAKPKALRPIEEHVKEWVKKHHPPPLIFSESEWLDSSDVFPIEIEDMREAHLLLRGTDPLEKVQTTAQDLRRELEREIRGKLLQLRTEFAAAASDGRALSGLLVDSAPTFFILFRAVIRLTGNVPPQDARSLVRETSQVTQNLNAHDPVGERYLEQIEKIASFIDSFDATDSAETPG